MIEDLGTHFAGTIPRVSGHRSENWLQLFPPSTLLSSASASTSSSADAGSASALQVEFMPEIIAAILTMLTQNLQVDRGCGDDTPQASSISVLAPEIWYSGSLVSLRALLEALGGLCEAGLANKL